MAKEVAELMVDVLLEPGVKRVYGELEMKAAGLVHFGTDLENQTSQKWPRRPVSWV